MTSKLELEHRAFNTLIVYGDVKKFLSNLILVKEVAVLNIWAANSIKLSLPAGPINFISLIVSSVKLTVFYTSRSVTAKSSGSFIPSLQLINRILPRPDDGILSVARKSSSSFVVVVSGVYSSSMML